MGTCTNTRIYPKITFSKKVLIFTNTANFHLKSLNLHGEKIIFTKNVLIFVVFILIYTECSINEDFSRKCPLFSYGVLLLVDLFMYSYEAEFVQKLLFNKQKILAPYLHIADYVLISINTSV